jgi:hypothetical protein
MFRAFPSYTPEQAAVHCRKISLAEFNERVKTHDRSASRSLARFKRLIAQSEAFGQSAHLIEWDDGIMVLILTPAAKTADDLTCFTLSAAYCYAVSSGDFFFIDKDETADA